MGTRRKRVAMENPEVVPVGLGLRKHGSSHGKTRQCFFWYAREWVGRGPERKNSPNKKLTLGATRKRFQQSALILPERLEAPILSPPPPKRVLSNLSSNIYINTVHQTPPSVRLYLQRFVKWSSQTDHPRFHSPTPLPGITPAEPGKSRARRNTQT